MREWIKRYPIDALKSFIGQNVLVKLKSGEEYLGKIHKHDDYMNMTLTLKGTQKEILLRGNNIIFIALAEKVRNIEGEEDES